LLSVPNIFMRPKEMFKEADEARANFSHNDGDHITMLNAYNAYKMKGDTDWCYKSFLNARSLKCANDIKD